MKTQESVWKIGAVVGVLLAIFLLALSIREFVSLRYVGTNPQMSNLITVDASADVVAVPDVATFSFTVNETAKTVADAQSAATTKTNAALKVVRDAGIEDRDISTLSYNINPRYEYQSAACSALSSYCPPGKSVLVGYEVSQTIQIKIRDLSKAGALFTSIGSLGVQNVDSLNFSVDDPEQLKAQARAEAIKKAQAKARTLARDLGVDLGDIVSFNESNGVGRPYYYGMGGDALVESKVAAAPEVPAGEQKITSTVSITYEIE